MGGTLERRARVRNLLDDAIKLRTDSGGVEPQALARLTDRLPTIDVGDKPEAALHRFGASALGVDPSTVTLARIAGEGAKGVSGSPVYLLKDSSGRPVAVVERFVSSVDDILQAVKGADPASREAALSSLRDAVRATGHGLRVGQHHRVHRALFLRSVLDEPPQAAESFVPPLGDLVERAARFVEPLRLQLPDTLPPAANVADETGAGKDIQVLGDGLTRDGGAGREKCDRLWAACAEPIDEREPRLVAERGKDRRRADEPGRPGATPQHIARCS